MHCGSVCSFYTPDVSWTRVKVPVVKPKAKVKAEISATEVNRAVLTARGYFELWNDNLGPKATPSSLYQSHSGVRAGLFSWQNLEPNIWQLRGLSFLLTLANYEKTRMKVSALLKASVQFGDGKTRRERNKTLTFSEILLLFMLPHSDNTTRRGRGEQRQIAVMFKYLLWNVAVSERTAHRTAARNPSVLLRSKSRLSTNQQSRD